MKFSREMPAGHLITAHDPDRVCVDGQAYGRSLALCADKLLPDWSPKDPDQCLVDDFAPILEWSPEIILFGTGRCQRFPDIGVLSHFRAQGIGFEVMDTAAACRTYNLILGEGRRVAAALIIENGTTQPT